ncbi:MAG: aspartate-semialdehyde dehydrogenase, partial [Burkholderiales bacterium]
VPVLPLLDAYDLTALARLDCIICTQGSEYTQQILPRLRQAGFTGYWLDASSCLRMDKDAIIVLDPINRPIIDAGLADGVKNFTGGNCTVSLMLMAIGGLFKHNLIEWVSSMTYQAASGAGANNMRELLQQSGQLYTEVQHLLADPQANILAIDKQVKQTLMSENLPTQHFGASLAGNVLPWIDTALENGQTREEWKGMAETNKILGLAPDSVKVDGICVRVGSMRCHSQALTIKLKEDKLNLTDIAEIIKQTNQWVKYVPNDKTSTLTGLTPVSVSNTLDIAVGRLRPLNIGEGYFTLFTVGDQLLWGAAEPIRRMLSILVEYHG